MSGEVLAWTKSQAVGKLYLTLQCRHQNNSALRWAPVVFMSHFSTSLIVGGQKPKVSEDGTCAKCKPQLLKRKEIRSRLEPIDLLTSLVPYCWAKKVHIKSVQVRCPFFSQRFRELFGCCWGSSILTRVVGIDESCECDQLLLISLYVFSDMSHQCMVDGRD